ncbi:MAG: lipopolysaccharide biosynthesis protein [Flavobacteriales bacterium]
MPDNLETPRFASSLSWQTANVATQVVLQLVFMAVLARLIAPEAFGLMAIALVVVGFVEIFAQVGIGPSIVHNPGLTPRHLQSAFSFSVLLGVLFFFGMWLGAPAIAQLYQESDLTTVLRVISLSFILSGAAIVPRSLLVKNMRFKELFISAVVAMLLGNWGIGLGLAWKGAGIWAYVAALLSQNTLLGIMYWWFSPVPVGVRWDRTALREMLGYGARSTLFNMTNYAAGKADTLIVGRLGAGWASTGFYDRSMYLMGLPVTVLGKLSDSVLFSGLSALQNRPESLRTTALSATKLLWMAVLPGTILLWLCAEEFTLLFLGTNYGPAVPIVSVLFLSIPARGLIKLSDAVVRATDHLQKALWIKFIYLLSIVATTCAMLMRGMDLIDVAWGIVVATWLQWLLLMLLTAQIVGWPWRSWFAALLPGTLMAFGVGVSAMAWLAISAEWGLAGRLSGALMAFGLVVGGAAYRLRNELRT